MSTRRAFASGFLLVFIAAGAYADSTAMLDQLSGLIDHGQLNVEVNLKTGRAAISPDWTIETVGGPKVTLTLDANHGLVECAGMQVTGGELVIHGKGWKPSLSIEGIQFEDGAGVIDARFRGRGVWRPLIAVFRTLARPALRRLQIPTDIRSILEGQILASDKSDSAASSQFLALVHDVRIRQTEFDAFPGYDLNFDDLTQFQTTALRASIDKATFVPPAHFDVDGRIDGTINHGSAAFLGSHCRFAEGKLERGEFHVADGVTKFSAGALTVNLTSGTFHWPGGPKIDVNAPSRFAVRNLRLNGSSYSGTVDATLVGDVGRIERGGVAVAAQKIQMTTHGATVADGKATGDVAVRFKYRLTDTFAVHYPVEELRDRKIPLNFNGDFAANLHFENAGDSDDGLVTGKYEFTIPWQPVEQAAFEVLRARWEQDVAPAIHRVDFAVEPRRFGPCGPECFILAVRVEADKPKTRGYWFKQICDSEGKASVAVDAPSRTILLRNVQIEPRCEGVLGALANFIAPFLTKSYSDMALLKMPKELPFTIDSVASEANAIVIAGQVAWSAPTARSNGLDKSSSETHRP